MCLVTKLYFLMVSISSMYKLTHTSAILNAWPIMKNYDIWGSHLPTSSKQNAVKYDTTMIVNEPNERSGKGINKIFPGQLCRPTKYFSLKQISVFDEKLIIIFIQ